jgi:Ca-activated chloride channel family protein
VADRELAAKPGKDDKAKSEAREKKATFDQTMDWVRHYKNHGVALQTGKVGVDLAVEMAKLRNQTKLEQTALRQVQGRTVLDVGGVWIDDGFTGKQTLVVIKAQSDAYFRILERHASMRDVYRLGNHLVWITPNGSALVIDTSDGKEKLGDEEIDKLFVASK